MHAIEKLQAYYNAKDKSDIYRDVVGNILKNIEYLENKTIYDVADMCYVSPTTISRLSKKLGYNGFQDMKSQLISAKQNYAYLNRYIPLSEIAKYGDSFTAYLEGVSKQVRQLKENLNIDQLTELANVIHESAKVNFYSNGILFSESRFQCDLIMTGKSCEIKMSPIEQMEDILELTDKDLIIITLPAVNDAIETKKILSEIKKHGAKVLMLTDVKYQVYQQYVDYLFSFEGVLGIVDDYQFAMFLNLLSMRYRELFIQE